MYTVHEYTYAQPARTKEGFLDRCLKSPAAVAQLHRGNRRERNLFIVNSKIQRCIHIQTYYSCTFITTCGADSIESK